MTSQNSVPALELRNILVPWRLLPTILSIEDNQAVAAQSMVCLALLAALFLDLTLIASFTSIAMLWLSAVAAAAYCATLLTLSFVILNALSMRR